MEKKTKKNITTSTPLSKTCLNIARSLSLCVSVCVCVFCVCFSFFPNTPSLHVKAAIYLIILDDGRMEARMDHLSADGNPHL